MAQKNDTIPLILAFLVTLGILGGGAWWFLTKSDLEVPLVAENPDSTNGNEPLANTQTNINPFEPPNTVPQGTTVNIAGSTSMVQINQALKNRFELQYPGTVVNTQAQGSSKGIEALLAGRADIAAISRPLTAQEEAQGLKNIAIAQDAIAIVVGLKNTFRTGLTSQQVQGIFQGSIVDWSAVGNGSGAIQVINRPPISGTHQAFQEIVLGGGSFGTGTNFTMMQQDATTPILQALGETGISYATYAQVANQQTVRIVPVDGLTPQAVSYPYTRTLYYVYQEPATPQAQAFLGFAGSPVGQSVVTTVMQ